MIEMEIIKRAADQLFGQAPEAPEASVGSFAPEGNRYALLYKTPSGMRLPYDKPEDIARLTAEDIKKAGDFPGHGANFAWDRVYWLFTLPVGEGKKALCCYSGTMNVDGTMQMESLTTESAVNTPEGTPLDTSYVQKNFQGQYPFKEGRLNLDQFSDADTVVIAEEHNSPLEVPADAEQLKTLPTFFHTHGKPYTTFRSSMGSFRIWDVKANHIATVDGKPDPKVQEAIQAAMANKAPEAEADTGAGTPGKEKEEGFTPLGPSGKREDERFAASDSEKYKSTSKIHKELSETYADIAKQTEKIEKMSSSSVVLQYLKSQKS